MPEMAKQSRQRWGWPPPEPPFGTRKRACTPRTRTDTRRSDTDMRRNDTDTRRNGTDMRRNGTDMRRNGTDMRRNGMDMRRNGTDMRRSGTDMRRSGTNMRHSHRGETPWAGVCRPRRRPWRRNPGMRKQEGEMQRGEWGFREPQDGITSGYSVLYGHVEDREAPAWNREIEPCPL